MLVDDGEAWPAVPLASYVLCNAMADEFLPWVGFEALELKNLETLDTSITSQRRYMSTLHETLQQQ